MFFNHGTDPSWVRLRAIEGPGALGVSSHLAQVPLVIPLELHKLIDIKFASRGLDRKLLVGCATPIHRS